jgi:uncharacterized protein involved in exopolysaccharide biosynthesis
METTTVSKYQNPLGYLKLFFRRKWFFIIPALAGLTFGLMAFFLVPPDFESYTVILVEEQRTFNPLIQDLAVATSVAQRLHTIREQVLGWSNLADLVKMLKLDSGANNRADYEVLILGLRRKIVVQMTQPNVIRLSFRSTDRERALLVTKTLTEIFIEENLKTQTRETDAAIEFLKDQLQVYKRKIKESEVNNIEEQLKTLLVDATDDHPMVKDLKLKLAEAKKELESGEYKIDGAEKLANDPMRKALQQELDRMVATASSSGPAPLEEPADTNAALYKLFIIDRIDSARARDLTVNQRIYEMLLQRLETAKITQRLEASKQGTRYTIIDPPRLPLSPRRPQFLVVIVGILLGLGSGVGLVFTRELLDQSYIDIDDAKMNLELPVLGAISRITTHEEIIRDKQRTIAWAATGAVIAVSLVTVAGLASLFLK